MRRPLNAVVVALLMWGAAVPAAAQTQRPPACLDVEPETAEGRTGSAVFLVVSLREKVAGSARCDGPTLERGQRQFEIDFEMTGANDPDAGGPSDSPASPDASCHITPGHAVEARCTVAVWGQDDGAETIRAWIDGDTGDPPDGIVEADLDEGRHESTQPGNGCIGSLAEPAEAEPDCTDVVELTWATHARCYSAPASGAADIAVFRRGEGIEEGLYEIDTASGETERITAPDDLRLWVWSPDRERLVYATEHLNELTLWATRPGGDDVQLTHNYRADEGPAWSPDSRRIVYSSYDYRASGPSRLWVVRADGTGTRRLTHLGGDSLHPDWSPDGRAIAFSRSSYGPKENRNGLFTISPDGRRVARILARHAAFPQYSPDGRRILFSGFTPGTSQLFVTSLNGRVRKLTDSAKPIVDWEWSPDGTKIAYETTSMEGWNELRVMNADGSSDRRIVRHFGLAIELAPSWSPDSGYVSYQLMYEIVNRFEVIRASDVWIEAVDESCADALTATPEVFDLYPAWVTQASTANPFDL